jgi:uncharacterized membrane protein
LRNVLLVIHILAAAAWIGGAYGLAFLASRFRRLGHSAGAAYMTAAGAMGRVYFNVAGVLVVLSGIWLVIDGIYDFEDPFVVIGFAVVVVSALLGALIYPKILSDGLAAHQKEDEAQVADAYDRLRRVSLLDNLILVVAVVAMVYKWGA